MIIRRVVEGGYKTVKWFPRIVFTAVLPHFFFQTFWRCFWALVAKSDFYLKFKIWTHKNEISFGLYRHLCDPSDRWSCRGSGKFKFRWWMKLLFIRCKWKPLGRKLLWTTITDRCFAWCRSWKRRGASGPRRYCFRADPYSQRLCG